MSIAPFTPDMADSLTPLRLLSRHGLRVCIPARNQAMQLLFVIDLSRVSIGVSRSSLTCPSVWSQPPAPCWWTQRLARPDLGPADVMRTARRLGSTHSAPS